MRYVDLIAEETVTKAIDDDIMDWISAYQNQGQPKAPMAGPNGLLAHLERQGYHAIDTDLIMQQLSGPAFSKIVKRSTPEVIYLINANKSPGVSKDTMDKSREKVMKGAAKGAEKMVKNLNKAGI